MLQHTGTLSVACELLNYFQHVGSDSLTRDWTQDPWIGNTEPSFRPLNNQGSPSSYNFRFSRILTVPTEELPIQLQIGILDQFMIKVKGTERINSPGESLGLMAIQVTSTPLLVLRHVYSVVQVYIVSCRIAYRPHRRLNFILRKMF